MNLNYTFYRTDRSNNHWFPGQMSTYYNEHTFSEYFDSSKIDWAPHYKIFLSNRIKRIVALQMQTPIIKL
jgi:hypothetical protein